MNMSWDRHIYMTRVAIMSSVRVRRGTWVTSRTLASYSRNVKYSRNSARYPRVNSTHHIVRLRTINSTISDECKEPMPMSD